MRFLYVEPVHVVINDDLVNAHIEGVEPGISDT